MKARSASIRLFDSAARFILPLSAFTICVFPESVGARSLLVTFSIGSSDPVTVLATEFGETEDLALMGKTVYGKTRAQHIIEAEASFRYTTALGFRLASRDETRLSFIVGDNVPTARVNCAGLTFWRAKLLEPCSISARDADTVIKKFGMRLSRPVDGAVGACYTDASGLGEATHIVWVLDASKGDPVILTKDKDERIYIGPASSLDALGNKKNRWSHHIFFSMPWDQLRIERRAAGAIEIKSLTFTPASPKMGDSVTLDIDYVIKDVLSGGIEAEENVVTGGPSRVDFPAMRATRKLKAELDAVGTGTPLTSKGRGSFSRVLTEPGEYTWNVSISAKLYSTVSKSVTCKVSGDPHSAGWRLYVTANHINGAPGPPEQPIRNGDVVLLKPGIGGMSGPGSAYFNAKGERVTDGFVLNRDDIPPLPLIRGRVDGGPVYYGVQAGEAPSFPDRKPGTHQFELEAVDVSGRVFDTLKFTVQEETVLSPNRENEIRAAAVRMANPKDPHNQFKEPIDLFDTVWGLVENRLERREWEGAAAAIQSIESKFSTLIADSPALRKRILMVRHTIAYATGNLGSAIATAEALELYNNVVLDYLALGHDVNSAYRIWREKIPEAQSFQPDRHLPGRVARVWPYCWPVATSPQPPK